MLQRIVALVLGSLLVGVVPASGQYFGRNKVRYEAFDFRILETPHFDIYHYPSEETAVGHAARLLERHYARLSQVLDHQFRDRQPIVLYASHAHFVQTTVVRGFLGEGVGGLTEHQRGRIVMPFTASLGETDHVLGHELVHAFQRDILRKQSRSIGALPLWYLEGMAEYLSIGRLDANTLMWLRDSAADSRLPTIEQLDDPRWFPYRYGQALWSYLAERFGEDIVARSLVSRAPRGAIGRIEAVTGVDAKTLSDDWHRWIKTMAGTAPVRRYQGDSKTIATRAAGGGRLNVGPALSPDGTEVVFLSERDQYSIDVYLADAKTGAIKRRLVRTAADPHFDSLQFIGSAGAWDPAGRRIALAAVHEGEPVLVIIDTSSGDVQREITIANLDEVYNPAWSPDGKRLAFSALKGGFSDLYVLELDNEKLHALTADPFGDLHPSWSPDGRSIAFTTDRFSSSIATLSFGNFRLGLIDVESHEVRELPGLPGAKHIDPQWSADGLSLYFVADADLASNIYRLHVDTSEIYQVTDFESGVSGVTALSPALSVASATGRLAFSVYRHGAYELHTSDAGQGTPLALPKSAQIPEVRDAPHVRAAAMPSFGLVDGEEFAVKEYRRGLSLDGIGQPYLSAGGGSLGTFVRAGVSFSFGDMLGQHSLRTALQVGKSVHDFAVQAAYVNRQSRWNWAVSGEQVPAVIGVSRMSPRAGEAAVIDEEVLFRQLHRRVSGAAIYPFSSAHRIELSTALHAIAFDQQSTTSVFSTRTGEMLNESRGSTVTAPPVSLIETGAALVHDSALLGPTSPILGRRYRFEVAPTFGDLTFATVLADYRRYVMPVRPFTVAMRVKHLGRYGVHAGDNRLLPLAFNVRDMVRGYNARALADDACGESGSAACAARHYLSTRQMLLANVEVRFPIVGLLRGTTSYGPLPLEGIAFSDTGWFRSGVAESGTVPTWQMRTSAGAGVRLNAAGFVFELAAARRFVGRSRGWTFAVNFRPGF